MKLGGLCSLSVNSDSVNFNLLFNIDLYQPCVGRELPLRGMVDFFRQVLYKQDWRAKLVVVVVYVEVVDGELLHAALVVDIYGLVRVVVRGIVRVLV